MVDNSSTTTTTTTAILTIEEEAIIRETWSLCTADMKGNGAKLFIHFFTDYPEYQKLFRAFAQIPLAQLPGNKKLEAHGFTVMSTINGLVQNLSDPEILGELLLKIGLNHSRHHLVIEDFQKLQKSILGFFAVALGNIFTANAKEAWSKLLTVMIKKIGEGLAEGRCHAQD